jgi:hypothetical protein
MCKNKLKTVFTGQKNAARFLVVSKNLNNPMKITYTLPSGKTAVIEISAEKNFDGTMSAVVTARVQNVGGLPETGLARPAGLPSWAVSAIGRLPLTAQVDGWVRDAVSAVEAEFAIHNARAVAHLAELDAISDSTRRVARRMAC